VLKNLRAELHRVISIATGEQYQALSQSICISRRVRAAGLNNNGLLDYTDIFSGGDIVHGLVSLNPALFAKGVAQKSLGGPLCGLPR
jgi:hypothetical protein